MPLLSLTHLSPLAHRLDPELRICDVRKIKYIRKTLYEIFLRDKEKMLVWLIGNQSKYADRKRVFKDYTQE